MTDIKEIGEVIKENLTWDKIGENLPLILAIGAGVYILDKSIDISGKVKLLTAGTERLNEAKFFEGIDTIGDNIQLIELILKQFKIEIGGDDLKKVADFLQNLGTAGKYIKQFVDMLKNKFRGGSSSKYNDLSKQLGYKL